MKKFFVNEILIRYIKNLYDGATLFFTKSAIPNITVLQGYYHSKPMNKYKFYIDIDTGELVCETRSFFLEGEAADDDEINEYRGAAALYMLSTFTKEFKKMYEFERQPSEEIAENLKVIGIEYLCYIIETLFSLLDSLTTYKDEKGNELVKMRDIENVLLNYPFSSYEKMIESSSTLTLASVWEELNLLAMENTGQEVLYRNTGSHYHSQPDEVLFNPDNMLQLKPVA